MPDDPIRNYYTFNGAVVAEYTPTVTGYRTYGRDALGSVLATYDDTGSLQNTYRYSPLRFDLVFIHACGLALFHMGWHARLPIYQSTIC